MENCGNHIAGITSLMNKQNVNQQVDLNRIENSVLNTKQATPPPVIHTEKSDIDKLAEELGLNLGPTMKIINLDDDIPSVRIESVAGPPSVASKCTHCSVCSKCSRRSTHLHKENKQDATYKAPVTMQQHVSTNEHENKMKVMSVFDDMRKTRTADFSMDMERTRDNKTNKIEQISNIVSTLDEEGMDISSIKIPSIDAPIEEIDSVLSLVSMKLNRTRYSSIFEELVIGGAEFMESKLNGTVAIPPFGWKPDYTGYSNTVNVKLHRMRCETSQIVGNAVEGMGLSSTSRILLELLPSLLLYPKTNAKHKKSADSYMNIRNKINNDWDALNNV